MRVTQVNDYYALGSRMTSSWTREDYPTSGGYYQSYFSHYDSLAGTYDFLLRNYDPLLGRWWQSDPYSQFASPYNGMGNAAHMGVDPDGGLLNVLYGIAIGGAIGAGLGLGVDYFNDRRIDDGYWMYGAIGGAIVGGTIGRVFFEDYIKEQKARGKATSYRVNRDKTGVRSRQKGTNNKYEKGPEPKPESTHGPSLIPRPKLEDFSVNNSLLKKMQYLIPQLDVTMKDKTSTRTNTGQADGRQVFTDPNTGEQYKIAEIPVEQVGGSEIESGFDDLDYLAKYSKMTGAGVEIIGANTTLGSDIIGGDYSFGVYESRARTIGDYLRSKGVPRSSIKIRYNVMQPNQINSRIFIRVSIK